MNAVLAVGDKAAQRGHTLIISAIDPDQRPKRVPRYG